MCDYSLHLVASRPATVGDKLVTTDFTRSITRGFSAVGEMNIWLSAMGLDTSVISANAITQAHVDRRRFTTTVDVELVNGTTTTYRVRGRRSQDKLASLIAGPLGNKCTISNATPG